MCAFSDILDVFKLRTPEPQTPGPESVFCSVSKVSGQFGGVYGVSAEIAYIPQALIVRILDSGVSSYPVLSKVPFQTWVLIKLCVSICITRWLLRAAEVKDSNNKIHPPPDP